MAKKGPPWILHLTMQAMHCHLRDFNKLQFKQTIGTVYLAWAPEHHDTFDQRQPMLVVAIDLMLLQWSKECGHLGRPLSTQPGDLSWQLLFMQDHEQ